MEELEFRIRRLTRKDIDAAQSLAQNVWGDQAKRDTGMNIAYPKRLRRMFEGYLHADPRGSFLATIEGKAIGASYGHKWGRVGWIGPIEVSTEYQKHGVGTLLAHATVDHLETVGCDTIGVETMGDSEGHVEFYRRIGFSVHSPTFFYEKRLESDPGLSGETILLPFTSYETILNRAKELSERISPGLDLSVEFWMSYVANLGRILVYQDPNDPEKLLGASVVYGRTMEGVDTHLLRLLIVDPDHDDQQRVANALLQDSEFLVRRMGGRRMFFSCPATATSVSLLAERGYRVIGNNVRMTRGAKYAERGEMQIISWAG
ncbi:MAG: putative acetyltransferase [Methanomassiliicoccales archaeon PtaU1.Bin124]|nr:MAG: putative acetyltransferase [Methanomassiliicoccales archaeon PtaU1.Bin124]